jgi:hypothetical protein
MNRKKLVEFFSSGLGLLILGFILTTVCGGLINITHSYLTWKRDKQFELLKGEIAKHEDLLSELTKVVGERVFRLQRVVWIMDPPAGPAPDAPVPETWRLSEADQKELKIRWDDYYKTVATWNVSYRTYAIKIRLLAGQDTARRFIDRDKTSGARVAKAGTLCGVVEETHRTVADLRSKALQTFQINRAEHEKAQRQVDNLYNEVDDFVTRLYEQLRERERSDDPVSVAVAP